MSFAPIWFQNLFIFNDDNSYWSWQIRAWINLCSVLIHIRYPLSDWSKTIYFIPIIISKFFCFRYNDATFSVPTTKHLQINDGYCIKLQRKSLSLLTDCRIPPYWHIFFKIYLNTIFVSAYSLNLINWWYMGTD